MRKKAAAVVGALSGLVAVDPSVLRADSFAGLLQPIPNAAATLETINAADVGPPVLVLAAAAGHGHHHEIGRETVRRHAAHHGHHPPHRRHALRHGHPHGRTPLKHRHT